MARMPKKVDALKHAKARRINVPTAELQSLAEQQEEMRPLPPRHFARARPLAHGEIRERDADLDPQITWNGVKFSLTREQVAQLNETGTVEISDAQLVWRGKDQQDWSDLVVNAPMLYVQEKVHPKQIIDDLKRQTDAARDAASEAPDLFADFNGLTDPEARAEFYQHAMYWQNRMILGDSLQVMASLAGREALKGKVQCIYLDPPYGIKFNSNWQVSTLSRDVKDGKREDVTREPEQVKAFRDTWKDKIHSYLTFLRDRLTVARELLHESGSIFVQIGDENVHRVRALMDEVFGHDNLISQIVYQKTTGATSDFIPGTLDYILWYARRKEAAKFHPILRVKTAGEEGATKYRKILYPDGRRKTASAEEIAGITGIEGDGRLYTDDNLTSQSMGRSKGEGAASWFAVDYNGKTFTPTMQSRWKTNENGMRHLTRSSRVEESKNILRYVRFLDDFRAYALGDLWRDIGGIQSRADPKVYVVQTSTIAVERCVLMTTDPGDLVLDPTCGSGTTAYVAEQWGRRWITIDTSRVALALARSRLMSARYQYYLLADSPEGRAKEQEVTGRILVDAPTHKDIRQGFVSERVPHVKLKTIVDNAQIDVIWERWQRTLELLREKLNDRLGRNEPWEEWQIPRAAVDPWPDEAMKLHAVASDEKATAKRRQTALAKLNAVLVRSYTLDTLPEAPIDRQGGDHATRPMVGGAHRPAEGDRRLHRPRRRRRISLRPSLRGQREGPRRRAVHGGEPVAAPRRHRAGRQPGRRDRGGTRRVPARAEERAGGRFRRHGAGASAHRRRAPEG
jgi:adenine-specific DNA-methyltransferase